MPEDSFHRAGVFDERKKPQSAATVRTREHVEFNVPSRISSLRTILATGVRSPPYVRQARSAENADLLIVHLRAFVSSWLHFLSAGRRGRLRSTSYGEAQTKKGGDLSITAPINAALPPSRLRRFGAPRRSSLEFERERRRERAPLRMTSYF
jgi:hypothetical protein